MTVSCNSYLQVSGFPLLIIKGSLLPRLFLVFSFIFNQGADKFIANLLLTAVGYAVP